MPNHTELSLSPSNSVYSENYLFPLNSIINEDNSIINDDIIYVEKDPLLFVSSKQEDNCLDGNWFDCEDEFIDNDTNVMLLNEEFEMQSISLSDVGSSEF